MSETPRDLPICRPARADDRAEYVRLRDLLWPGSKDAHGAEIDAYFRGESRDVVVAFVLDRGEAPTQAPRLGGFLELNVRNYAEGSRQPHVPYVEGWFVDDDLRRRGAGRRLMDAAEDWVRENGFRELASDTELDNSVSLAAHEAVGFEEVERVVCFLKRLDHSEDADLLRALNRAHSGSSTEEDVMLRRAMKKRYRERFKGEW